MFFSLRQRETDTSMDIFPLTWDLSLFVELFLSPAAIKLRSNQQRGQADQAPLTIWLLFKYTNYYVFLTSMPLGSSWAKVKDANLMNDDRLLQILCMESVLLNQLASCLRPLYGDLNSPNHMVASRFYASHMVISLLFPRRKVLASLAFFNFKLHIFMNTTMLQCRDITTMSQVTSQGRWT